MKFKRYENFRNLKSYNFKTYNLTIIIRYVINVKSYK